MLSVLLLAAFAVPAQEPVPAALPEGVVATWDGGKILTGSFERFLGRSFKNKQLGMDALRHILQIQLVERESDRRGLMVPPNLVDSRLAEAEQAAEDAGYDLPALLKSRGMNKAEFRKLLGDSILHEMMARLDLGLAEGAPVSNEQLTAWSDDRLADLLKRAKAAPAGLALDANPYRVSIQELGQTLREILGPQRKIEYLQQMVLEEHLPAWAEQHKLVLTDDVLQAEMDWRKRRVEENPAYGGATYADLLRTQGATVDSVRKGSELRLAGLLRLYSRKVFDETWFTQLAPDLRQQLENEYGDRRQVSWFFLTASEEKKTEIDLNFAEAAQELQAYATRITDVNSFKAMAEQYSEHDVSRRRKGELGWISRTGAGVDPKLAEAAFDAPVGTIYGPVKVSSGMALIWVHHARPVASEEAFREDVRRGRHVELRKRMLEEIRLRTVFDPPASN
jgi:parvulin-like peptidyl-prolyl isomerase